MNTTATDKTQLKGRTGQIEEEPVMADAEVLKVLEEHLVAPLSGNPHVLMIAAEKDVEGWQVWVFTDSRAPEVTLPVAEQIGEVYDTIHGQGFAAPIDNHIWQWHEELRSRTQDMLILHGG